MQDFVKTIREYEYDCIKGYLPRSAKVLEIGAGAGWQSRKLSEDGFDVKAIDICTSKYKAIRVWPVEEYDGFTLPFPEHSFDVVFSSNVMEHISHFNAYQAELHRVLRPGGLAIHVLPSSTWRIWTTIAHYPFLIKMVFEKLLACKDDRKGSSVVKDDVLSNRKPPSLRNIIHAPRHGELGNVMTEIYYFSRKYWRARFINSGWDICDVLSTHIFYTGYCIMGDKLAINARKRLSKIFGSSSIIFILTKHTVGC